MILKIKRKEKEGDEATEGCRGEAFPSALQKKGEIGGKREIVYY